MSRVSPVQQLDFILAMHGDLSLPAAALRVGALLTGLYNHERGFAWPSRDLMVARLGMDQRTIGRAVEALARAGWFSVVISRGRGRACEYRPIWSRATKKGGSETTFSEPDKGGNDATFCDEERRQPCPEKAASTPKKGGIPAHKRRQGDHPIPLNNPLNNPSINPLSGAAAPQSDSINGIEDEGKLLPQRPRHDGEAITLGQALGSHKPLTTAEKASRFEASLIDYAKKELSRERFERWLLGFIEDPSRVEAESIALDARRRADGPNGLPPSVALMQAKGAVRSNINGRPRSTPKQVAIKPIGVGG